MSIEIADKVALVTGANRGIGKAITEALLAAGAKKIYLAVRNPDSTQELSKKYQARVVPLQVDMANPEDIAALADQASDAQIVVNNAGVLTLDNPFSEDLEANLEYQMTVNVLGLIRIAKAFKPVWQHNGGGALVQLNSVASITAFSDFSAYSASKAAAYSFTQSMRATLSPLQVHVLSVHPGPIATDMAVAAGIAEFGEPATVVADKIVAALHAGDFHLFPDTVARKVGDVYQPFAEKIIESDWFGA